VKLVPAFKISMVCSSSRFLRFSSRIWLYDEPALADGKARVVEKMGAS